MSDKKDNIINFPTTAEMSKNQVQQKEASEPAPPVDTSPEGLKKMAAQGDEFVLQLVEKNRKLGVVQLEKQVEKLERGIERIRDLMPNEALWTSYDSKGSLVFSLEDFLRTTLAALKGCLTTLEASNSLSDMLLHDLGGTIQNLESYAKALWIENANLQVLMEVLRTNKVITEEQMKETWNKLIPQVARQVQQHVVEEEN